MYFVFQTNAQFPSFGAVPLNPDLILQLLQGGLQGFQGIIPTDILKSIIDTVTTLINQNYPNIDLNEIHQAIMSIVRTIPNINQNIVQQVDSAVGIALSLAQNQFVQSFFNLFNRVPI